MTSILQQVLIYFGIIKDLQCYILTILLLYLYGGQVDHPIYIFLFKQLDKIVSSEVQHLGLNIVCISVLL